MSKYDSKIIMADTVSGVQVIEIEDYPEAEMLSIKAFKEELPTLEDGEQIFAMIMPKGTDGEWEDLDEEYGIH